VGNGGEGCASKRIKGCRTLRAASPPRPERPLHLSFRRGSLCGLAIVQHELYVLACTTWVDHVSAALHQVLASRTLRTTVSTDSDD